MASFPLANIFSGSWFSTISPYPNGDVRTDLPADSTPRAGSIPIPNDVKIPLTINFLPDLNQSLGTGNRAEPTPLASLSVNFNLGHDSPAIKVEILISPAYSPGKQFIRKLITYHIRKKKCCTAGKIAALTVPCHLPACIAPPMQTIAGQAEGPSAGRGNQGPLLDGQILLDGKY